MLIRSRRCYNKLTVPNLPLNLSSLASCRGTRQTYLLDYCCCIARQIPGGGYRSFHGDVIRHVTWSPGIPGWQKICCCLASRVFCQDSILVCIHFTHTQDHDFVLYWCGVHCALCGRLVLFCYHQKKGKTKKNMVECVQL